MRNSGPLAWPLLAFAACHPPGGHLAPADLGEMVQVLADAKIVASTPPHRDVPPPAEAHGYLLDAHEVTVASYTRCIRLGKCAAPTRASRADPACNYARRGRERHPINCISPLEAADYCATVGKRLPTRWEWYWATTGGDQQRPNAWGAAPEPRCDRVVSDLGMCHPDEHACPSCVTWPTGSRPAGNGRSGASDLQGNVGEYVIDGAAYYLVTGATWVGVLTPHSLQSLHTIGRAVRPDQVAGPRAGFRCARG